PTRRSSDLAGFRYQPALLTDLFQLSPQFEPYPGIWFQHAAVQAASGLLCSRGPEIAGGAGYAADGARPGKRALSQRQIHHHERSFAGSGDSLLALQLPRTERGE